MPFLVLILVALAAGSAVAALAWRYPRVPAPVRGPSPAPAPALAAARAVGEQAGLHPRLRALLAPRLDPQTATGLALTLALGFTLLAGVLSGLLTYLVRTNSSLIGVDNGAARWANRHATELSTDGLNAVTHLGSIYVVIVLGAVLALVETVRTHSRWIIPFMFVVLAGQEALSLTIKAAVDRVRPDLNPIAAGLGPSFPSGHSMAAAAFWAAAALILGRGRGHSARALLAGLAAGIGVAVASSRVLLDVHWLTDVIAGLAIGWAWFALCAIAFGGRLLRFGVAAEVAGRVADVTEATDHGGRPASLGAARRSARG
jgi:membrane-associated phospholipid phosphatase